MALEHESDSALARAVRAAGSQSAFGRLLRKRDKPVRQSTVREWLKADRLPPEHAIAVEAATGVSRYDLCPDIYQRDAVAAPAAIAPADRFEHAR